MYLALGIGGWLVCMSSSLRRRFRIVATVGLNYQFRGARQCSVISFSVNVTNALVPASTASGEWGPIGLPRRSVEIPSKYFLTSSDLSLDSTKYTPGISAKQCRIVRDRIP